MRKRFWPLLLCLCMVLTLLPAAAVGPAVATLAWTEGGENKTAQLTEWEVCTFEASGMLADADGNTPSSLIFLSDTIANLYLNKPGSLALTSGQGGPYILHRDPEDRRGCVLYVEYDSTATVTNLTLDGGYTEPPEHTERPEFITVGGELTLGEGATVRNCQPKKDPSSTMGGYYLPPAAVDVSGGSLILESGSKIVNNQATRGGVVKSYDGEVSLSGNVTIKGNEAVDCSESSFEELATAPRTPANLVVYKNRRKAAAAPVQVTGALTGGEGSIGLTMLDEEGWDPEPTTGRIVAGVGGYTLTGDDLAAFFSDRAGYFLHLNREENTIYLEEYVITTQPTAESPTVVVNQTEGAAYQWYPASIVTEAVTDRNTTEGRFACTYADGKWTAGEDEYGSEGYFTMALKKGDVLTVTVETIPSDGSLYLYDRASGKQDYTDFQTGQTVYTLTAPADGTYGLEPDLFGGDAPVISATVTGIQLGTPVSGQTTATLSAPTAGDYLCQVTWPDGTVLQSGVISVAAPPHKHAVSVDCEASGGAQATFLPLTVNSGGKLCVDGTALASNNSLPAGSYYLPENITLNAYIAILDAANAPVNLCLNGHTLDLGDGYIGIEAINNRGKGVLNLCDCGTGGKVTSANSGSYTNAATIEVTGQFSLYGGTVENTAATARNNHAVGLNGGTANLCGGKLISQTANALWVNGWQAKGLTLSGNVGFQGGAAKADIYFDASSIWENNTHFTLAGPLTQPSAPWRVAEEDGLPMPLVTGWSQHMGQADFDHYFRSATQGLFVGRRENGDLELAQCAIIQQPSAANSYTVAANGAPVSVPAYQWYPATVTTADVTTDNAAVYSDEYEGTAAYDPATKLWSGVGRFEYRYFTIHLSKGDVVTVKPNTQLPDFIMLGLELEPDNYDYWIRLGGDEANPAGEYVLTAPVESDYIFYCNSGRVRSADSEGELAFSARVTHTELGGALTGQTTATLATVPEGDYLCRVTWPDGTALDSDVVAYVPLDPGESKGEVEVNGEDTPAVNVEQEALKDLAGEVQAGDTVKVKLTVEKQAEPVGKDEIAQLVTGKKDDVLYLDLSLVKQVNNAAPEAITDTGEKVLEIEVTYDFTGKKDVTVYRKHGEADAEALTRLTARPADGFTDGSFFADSANGKLYIYASKFSTYAIGYTEETLPTPPSSRDEDDDEYYTIAAMAGPGGSVSPSGRVSIREYGDRTFTVTPGEGYVVADVLVDGKSVSAVEKYTFEKVRRDHTIEALFRKAGTRPAWNPFEDVKAESWFHDSVKAVYEQGLMEGVDSTRFAPGTTTSRAMMAAILWRLEGSPEPKAGTAYPDCVEGSWYAKAVAWATEQGVVRGYGNGNFGPEDPVTREQLAAMLYRYAGSPTGGTLEGFSDAGQAGSWAAGALGWAVEQGVLTGRGGSILDPTGQATRAEAAAMLARFCEGQKTPK